MSRLIFVRHGQSIANAGGVTMEHALIPLSPLGAAQAECVAGLLPAAPSRVLVSPYVRARDTARPYGLRVGREPEVDPLLQEFSAIDPALLEGMTGVERRPIADAYWQTSDPAVRMGANADTFLEFNERVSTFILGLGELPDKSILFGHGIWFALLWWKLRGFRVEDSDGMRAFTDFRRKLPMPNCAVYVLGAVAQGRWSMTADTRAMRAVTAV